MLKRAFVYIMASRRNGTLYTGVTNNVVVRADQHRRGEGSIFTKRYGVRMLVYYEEHTSIASAIQRESNIKHWPRRWKLEMIESINPDWNDLFDGFDGF